MFSHLNVGSLAPTNSQIWSTTLEKTCFLGGLSLNHLIAQRVSAPYWQFGTLPIGIFLSNLDSSFLNEVFSMKEQWGFNATWGFR